MNKPELNAYRRAPEIRPGCTHQLGCRCEPPFWLRASSPAEEVIAARLFGPAITSESSTEIVARGAGEKP